MERDSGMGRDREIEWVSDMERGSGMERDSEIGRDIMMGRDSEIIFFTASLCVHFIHF